MRVAAASIWLLVACWPAVAQTPDSTAAQREAMKKLEWMVGKWKGSGWIQLGPQGRQEFEQSETVQPKLDGLVLVVEGLGTDRQTGRVVHQALAFVSYDNRAETYRWQAFTARGQVTNVQAKVSEGTLEWGMDGPDGSKVRFIIRLSDDGQWSEVGESSMDGQSWNKFFEMALAREN